MKSVLVATTVFCCVWTTSVALADYATTVLEDQPVAYYRFEEDNDLEILDSSGNGHHSLEVLDVEFGKEGIAGSKAAEFLGFSTILLDLNLDPSDPRGDGGGGFTIESWLNSTGVEEIEDPDNPGEFIEVVKDQQVYVAQKDGDGLGRSDMLISANRQLGSFIGGNTTDAADPFESDFVEVNRWYHFVMTIDLEREDLDFYVDGVPSDLNPQFPGANGVEPANGEWVIGSHKNQVGQYFEGFLDEIAFYDYALSEDRIQAHYNAAIGGESIPGDYDDDGQLTAVDIDVLSAAVRDGLTDTKYDLNSDGSVNSMDREVWVNDLKRSWMGDSNLDGEFNSSDFVLVFTAGEYEDAVDGNSGWASGDWNGDADFTSSDFVAAFTAGGYELGPRPAVSAVPEPGGTVLLLVGFAAFAARRKPQDRAS